MKALNNVNGNGKKGNFCEDIECSYDLPTNKLYGGQYRCGNYRNALTKLVHCSSIKIHGCARLHRRATMSIDTQVNRVAASNIAFDIRVWVLFGDKRRNRNATEHFVSQRVTM